MTFNAFDKVDLDGGFSDPVFQGQSVFKAIMEAMAHPGSIYPVLTALQPPMPLLRATAAVILALCDGDTPLWLDQSLEKKEALAAWLSFQTGAEIIEQKQAAAFALMIKASDLTTFKDFAQGSQDYPDRSTTLVLQVRSFNNGRAYELQGPGIKEKAILKVSGLSDQFETALLDNRALFPRGVDLILTTGNEIACLPRTTRLCAVKEG